MDIRYKIKSNKLLFKLRVMIQNQSYRRGYLDYLLARHSKPSSQVRREIRLLRDYWGCAPMHYFSYRLFDKQISKQDLINYVPYYYMYNIHIPAACVNIDMRSFDDKIILDQFFNKKGIACPKTLAFVERGKLRDSSHHQLSFSLFKEKLQESKARRFFIKPTRGSGGKGIFIIEKTDNHLMMKGEVLRDKKLYKNLGSSAYIIQEGLKQRDDFSLYNPTSINTLRVLTRRVRGEINIKLVVLRVGLAEAFLDNTCMGGHSVGVNVKTGELNAKSGILFKNNKIKDWEKIREGIIKIATRVDEIDEIAWDIAVCADGLSVIEINIFHGIDLFQLNCGGIRQQLGINLEK